jgi:1,4-dihydroxy-2-naphthoyl-CoA hydrolase
MDRVAQLNDNMLPFAKLLGLRFTAAELDRLVAEMVVRDEHCTTPAVMHGGAIMAMADNMGGIAAMINLPPGARTTTLESKTNFIAAAPVGSRVLAETTPVHKGRTTMIWQTRITLDSGRLVALVTQTQLVLPAKP